MHAIDPISNALRQSFSHPAPGWSQRGSIRPAERITTHQPNDVSPVPITVAQEVPIGVSDVRIADHRMLLGHEAAAPGRNNGDVHAVTPRQVDHMISMVPIVVPRAQHNSRPPEIAVDKRSMPVRIRRLNRTAHEIRQEVRLNDVETLLFPAHEIAIDPRLIVRRLANRLIDNRPRRIPQPEERPPVFRHQKPTVLTDPQPPRRRQPHTGACYSEHHQHEDTPQQTTSQRRRRFPRSECPLS